MVASLLAVVFSMSVTFSATEDVVRIAEVGTEGIHAEATLSAAAATRNRAVQAYLIRTGADHGVAGEAELTAAIDATEDGARELSRRLERLSSLLATEGERSEIRSLYERFAASVTSVVDLLRHGSTTAEAVAGLGDLDDQYEDFATLLVARRDAASAELELAAHDAGRIGTAARFLVAVAVPISIVLLVRRILRRRQRQVLLEQELARQREVVETKDHFIADLSHQLRTPLTGVVGFASALLDEGVTVSGDTTREFAAFIAKDAEDLSRMVDDLLAAGRAKVDGLELIREPVDPATEVEAVVGPMRAWGTEVQGRVESHLLAVDRARLRQVIRDVVSNACKHGEPPIVVTGSPADGSYRLEISDRGAGVPAELEERLYQRYIHRGRDPLVAGSVGLGLNVASMLVDMMGGDLSYRREHGATVFSVDLPLWRDEDPLEGNVSAEEEENQATQSPMLN